VGTGGKRDWILQRKDQTGNFLSEVKTVEMFTNIFLDLNPKKVTKHLIIKLLHYGYCKLPFTQIFLTGFCTFLGGKLNTVEYFYYPSEYGYLAYNLETS
jgi:hypothetical protein